MTGAVWTLIKARRRRRSGGTPTSLFHHHLRRPLFKNGVGLDEWDIVTSTAPATIPGTTTPFSFPPPSPWLAVNLQSDRQSYESACVKTEFLKQIFAQQHQRWTHSSLAFLLIILGVKVFCKIKIEYLWDSNNDFEQKYHSFTVLQTQLWSVLFGNNWAKTVRNIFICKHKQIEYSKYITWGIPTLKLAYAQLWLEIITYKFRNFVIYSNSPSCCITFFTPPRVRSLDRIEGRRPGEMADGGRRPASGPRVLPPGVGARWLPGSPDPESAILNWWRIKTPNIGDSEIIMIQQFMIVFHYFLWGKSSLKYPNSWKTDGYLKL